MKALALFSGGLDSTLAIKVILEQGIEVIALNFMSPFCRCDRSKGCSSAIKDMADKLGVEFNAIYMGDDYIDMIKNPQYGYGKNMNPCIDCRIMKFKKAKEYMEKVGASFIITGEVLGQRPMSQHRRALKLIEKESGLSGLILRPLSAKLLEPTIAEERGWLRREALLDINGRGRKPQIELAANFGIKDYPCPAGGCLLTDPTFSKRLKDALKHNDLRVRDIELLKSGRYFRISPSFWLSVGRDQKDNEKLMKLADKEDTIFGPLENVAGPTAVGRGEFHEDTKLICSRIVARYIKHDGTVSVRVISPGGREKVLNVKALPEMDILNLMR